MSFTEWLRQNNIPIPTKPTEMAKLLERYRNEKNN